MDRRHSEHTNACQSDAAAVIVENLMVSSLLWSTTTTNPSNELVMGQYKADTNDDSKRLSLLSLLQLPEYHRMILIPT